MWSELAPIVVLSLYVSSIALFFAVLLGVPLGAWLGLYATRGKRWWELIIYTGMGFPTVVVGLLVYLLLSRSGPLGVLGWLFTPRAIIGAQVIIALPMVASLTQAAFEALNPNLRMLLRSWAVTPQQEIWTLLSEARGGMLVAIIAAFGRIFSEVGAVMLVGGNIQGQTRVLTTAIVLETRQGEFDLALALGALLLIISALINALVLRFGKQRLF
ncbi:MAG: ABC transporter permease [Caldilineaceae bacterium]